MTRVAIVGASGYTGVELASILSNHPMVEITAATSRQYAGLKLSAVFPNLRDKIDIECENLSTTEICDRADIIFTAVPHKTAMDIAPLLLAGGKTVIDLSADYRLRDLATYEQWYQPHSSSELLAQAVYGLPELYRQEVASARLIANPGCYPTGIILALAPLLRANAIDTKSLIIDSKTGASGAGRSAAVGTLFCEVADGFRPYKVGRTHRHTPEIEQELSLLSGDAVPVTFTPHLLPISRGILNTIYAQLPPGSTSEKIHDLLTAAYTDEPFVRVLPEGALPATQYVRGSNYCDIGFAIDTHTNRLILMSAIDNVFKGSSGQAIQNMNIICGFPETSALDRTPLFP